MKNKISLLSIFFYSLAIALLVLAAFTISQKHAGIPASYLETKEVKPTVVTDISNYRSLEAITGHRDTESGRFNSMQPLLDSCSPEKPETHRFIYHDTWFENAFALTLSDRNGSANAAWQKLTGNRAKKRFEYSVPQNHAVSNADWETLKTAIRNTRFLEMTPIASDENGYPLGGADGDSWTIESCVNGRYHFAYRWTPYGHEHDSFREVGKAMVVAGGSVYDTRNVQVIE